jgi:zinc protease
MKVLSFAPALRLGLPPSRRLRPSALVAVLASTALSFTATTTSAQVAKNAVRQSVGGIELVVLQTGVREVVTIRGSIAAGDGLSPDTNPALADLTGGMLDKGTTTRDKYAIAQLLGDVGATISFSTGPSSLNVNAKCLRQNLPLVIGLIAEQLRTPAFSPEELAKLKKQFAGIYRRQSDDTDFRADDAFSRAIYPAGHPNRQAPGPELLAGAEKTTLADVKAFHAKNYGPATFRLVLVGDVDPAAARAEVAKVFAGWTGGERAPKPAPAKAGGLDTARDQNVFMPEKTNLSLIWGQPTGLRYADTDTLALRVGTAALGSGFTGRLMANVRDKEGLTYGIGSSLAHDTFSDGDWKITATFAPALLEKGLGVKQDLTAAAVYYQKAADQGNPAGMSGMGVLLRFGRGGIKKDTAAAARSGRRVCSCAHSAGHRRWHRLDLVVKLGQFVVSAGGKVARHRRHGRGVDSALAAGTADRRHAD